LRLRIVAEKTAGGRNTRGVGGSGGYHEAQKKKKFGTHLGGEKRPTYTKKPEAHQEGRGRGRGIVTKIVN